MGLCLDAFWVAAASVSPCFRVHGRFTRKIDENHMSIRPRAPPRVVPKRER
jgi:hypothetical protein